jgi:sugar lactone lactonase YvrE
VAVDANGNVYVADGGNARIHVFSNALAPVAVYDTVGSPWALCITSGPHQYLFSASNLDRTDVTKGDLTGEIYKLELDGTIVGRFGRSDNSRGAFKTPHFP